MRDELNNELNNVLRNFMGEINDHSTWERVKDAFYEFFNSHTDVKEFAVKCDQNNNTAERIAAHELWVDVAVLENGEKEFTYYPLRLAPNKIAEEAQ